MPRTTEPRVLDENGYSGPSKSQLKREMLELQDLGGALQELSETQLDTLDLPAPLRTALREMRRLTNLPARRRQEQFLGKLLRGVDTAPLLHTLEERRNGRLQDVQALKEVERWRERLLAGAEGWAEWVIAHPAGNTPQLRALVRNALREKETMPTAGPFYRELFKSLRNALQAPGKSG